MLRRDCGCLLVLSGFLAGSSCLDSDPFECTIDAQCNGDIAGALCQDNGFCSFPDDTCPSGQRYGDLAGGGLANECVDEPPSGTSSGGEPSSGGTSTSAEPPVDSSGSSSSMSSSTTDDPPSCGGLEEPCCDGVCDPGGICVAGTCQACTLLLDVDEYYSCAIRSDGVSACWGDDAYGQLADGPTAHPGGSSEPVLVDAMLDGLDLGAFHGCGTDSDEVLCWGRNDWGQLGLGSTYPQQPTPLVVPLTEEVSDLAAGSYHSCALTIVGEVWCWGRNGAGQLGDPVVGESDTPLLVVPLDDDVVDVAAGAFHTCALDAAGTVTCWGRNDRGELGTLDPVMAGELVEIGGMPPARALTLGDFHGCIIADGSDEVWCWGANDRGQTGEGGVGDPALPHLVTGVSDVLSMDAGDDHTCMITPGGTACWGNNVAGQLGTPGEMFTPVPQFLEVAGVTRVRGGREHTCVVTNEPQILCFGANGSGQLGDGTFIGGPTPVPALFGCDY